MQKEDLSGNLGTVCFIDDWNIGEYEDDDQFVVFSQEEVHILKQLVDESL